MKCLFVDGPRRGTVREVTAQVLRGEMFIVPSIPSHWSHWTEEDYETRSRIGVRYRFRPPTTREFQNGFEAVALNGSPAATAARTAGR